MTSNEEYLPGGLNVKRRAKKLYTRLTRGLYAAPPGASFVRPGSNEVGLSVSSIGRIDHPLQPVKPKRFSVPAMEVLTAYAIAVNEVNASGGRVVTAPTNVGVPCAVFLSLQSLTSLLTFPQGAAGVIPSVLKYFIEFIVSHVLRTNTQAGSPPAQLKGFLLLFSCRAHLTKPRETS